MAGKKLRQKKCTTQKALQELRYNPLLDTWVMVAAKRQSRPHMAEGNCPFCPSPGGLKNYDVLKYDNDFPALSLNASVPGKVKSKIYRNSPAYGKCEVILYSPGHKKTLHELTLAHVAKIIDLWVKRCAVLSKNKKIKYVFPFENKGEEVGVTMIHPHGQIYAYPFVPLKIKTELDNAKKYYSKRKRCIVCDMNRQELKDSCRLVFENESFIAYLPHFTDYPYGVFISSKKHRPYLTSLSKSERRDLAEAIKVIQGTFDRVFNRPFPLMMCVHQCPVNSPEYKDSKKYFHLHIEFYTPLRAKDRIKYYASSESGAWAAANVAAVEDTAKQLVSAKHAFFSKSGAEIFKKEFIKSFTAAHGGRPQGVSVYRAPARINIIGEHIDYNGGLVMPAAIGLYAYAAFRKRADNRIVIKDLNAGETITLNARGKNKFNKKIFWANYPAGVINAMTETGFVPPRGFDVLFFSEIPKGAGISSSAAFETVFASGIASMSGIKISRQDIALICRKAENEFVGVKCGIMDQFASAMSKKNKATLLDCAKLKYEYIPFKTGKYRIIIANSNKERVLAGSKYNTRLAECRKALKLIQKRIRINNLCDMELKSANRVLKSIKQHNLKKRVIHAVSENERVKKAARALKESNYSLLGRLLNESHISLRDNYEVTGPELNALFKAAVSREECIGSRMTGAGFGGCTISLVHKDRVFEFKNNVLEEYRKKTGLYADFYECIPSQGASKI